MSSKKKSEPKKQHTVPQLYLKNFALADTPPNALFVYDKNQDKVFQSGIDSISVKKHIYTTPSLKDKYKWERAYAEEVEPKLKKELDKLIGRLMQNTYNYENGVSNVVVISNEEKALFADCLVKQLTRSPFFVAKLKRIGKQVGVELGNRVHNTFYNGLSKEQKSVVDSLYEENNPIIEDSIIKATIEESAKNAIDKLAEFCWVFYRLPQAWPFFMTSDDPVVITDMFNGYREEIGLNGPLTAVYYPLSPHLLLVAYSPANINLDNFNKYNGKILLLDVAKEKDVMFLIEANMLQKKASKKQVISGCRECLECFLKKNN